MFEKNSDPFGEENEKCFFDLIIKILGLKLLGIKNSLFSINFLMSFFRYDSAEEVNLKD